MPNIQLYPSKMLRFPNDSVAKRLFDLTDEDYLKSAEDRSSIVDVIEKRNHGKLGNVLTSFRFHIDVDDNTDFTLSEPLDQFDFAVLCACISEWINKSRFTTPSVIYRAITGKVGRGDAEPSKNQLIDILQSVDKLMRTQIAVNMTDACEKLNYNGRKAFSVSSTILPCKRVTETTINGKKSTVIQLLDKSPLFEIAEMKNNQILSCQADILDVPGQQNTRMNIAVKTYVLRRVLEITAHSKQLRPTVTFADIFKKCHLTDANRKKKFDARETVTSFFEHLQSKEVIQSLQLNKDGNSFRSISFTWKKK